MNSKFTTFAGFLVLIGIIVYVLLVQEHPAIDQETDLLDAYIPTEILVSDTTKTDPVLILPGESLVLATDAVLTTEQDITINGALGCEDGSLTLVSNGKITINNTVVCQGTEGGGGDVTIVAAGGLEMAPEAQIVASGDVQLVDDVSLVRDAAARALLYDKVTQVPEAGVYVGPFVDGDSEAPETTGEGENEVSRTTPRWLHMLSNVAHAQVDNGTTTVNQTREPIRVSGKIKIETPQWKWTKRIVVFDFPNTPEVTIQDFVLEGPAGRTGDSNTGACDVTGKDGEDAFRFNAVAPSLVVNNFTLTLGDGGSGGEAITGDGCDDARAQGGDGGNAGNFRMIGNNSFEIKGAFMIHPGSGGAGGAAEAKGKTGNPGEKGGDARATGGDGADNKKKLSVSGTVAGTNLVKFGDAVGGQGGQALAEGGSGGDATACGLAGGDGGMAIARGGNGGDAKLSVSGGASRMEFANDIGGAGGLIQAIGGAGGAGGSCDETAKGGDGGRGGDANVIEGRGGLGKNGNANNSNVLFDDGGNGGNGGDGCTEGAGGAGGAGGASNGVAGADGRNLCLSITKEEDYISLVPGEIEVIAYKGKYLPVSQLHTFTDTEGDECDNEEHWHGNGGVLATDGTMVYEEDPACGYGKTSEVPVVIIQDPNYVEVGAEAENEAGGGEMIQIDPPTLVIPAQ